MALPTGDNIYDVQGTILYRVINEEQHSREMIGYSAIIDEPTGATLNANSNINNNNNNSTTTTNVTPSAAKTLSGTAGLAANLGAQRSVSAAAAAALAASASATAQRKPTRLDPIGAAKRKSVSEGAGAPPLRSQPLAFTSGGKTTNSVTNAGEDGAAPATNTLTVEKALEALIPAAPLDADPAEADGAVDDDDDDWLKVPALDHTSRIDVMLLFQHLMRRCEEEHARPRGVLCPTREAIFDDGMTEVTRQVTVLCPERGYLLHELVKGMGQNTETYDVLADNASQYAVRKATERDLRQHLFLEKTELESEVRRIENRVNELRAKYDGLKKRFDEQSEANEKMREEEVAYLKTANQQLVNEIKRLSNLEATQKAA